MSTEQIERTALRIFHDAEDMCVFTHPLDDATRGFHARRSFVDLLYDPHWAMIVRMVDLERSG